MKHIIKEVFLQNGEKVKIKRAVREDFSIENYKFFYLWLMKVEKFLYFSPDLRRLERDWKIFLDGMNNKIILVALNDSNKIIGECEVIRYKSPKVSHVGTLGIAIHPSYQKLGLGTALVKLMEELAKKEGIKKIELSVIEGNIGAMKLFKNLGYFEEGVRLNKFRHSEGFRNEIEMAKIIK